MDGLHCFVHRCFRGYRGQPHPVAHAERLSGVVAASGGRVVDVRRGLYPEVDRAVVLHHDRTSVDDDCKQGSGAKVRERPEVHHVLGVALVVPELLPHEEVVVVVDGDVLRVVLLDERDLAAFVVHEGGDGRV